MRFYASNFLTPLKYYLLFPCCISISLSILQTLTLSNPNLDSILSHPWIKSDERNRDIKKIKKEILAISNNYQEG